jgi:hypothetical protein
MKYWIDLFTWKTWQEFMNAGAHISGFSEFRWPTVQKIKLGDLLLCYLTGLSRFFAILEVTGKPYHDTSAIWEDAIFPSRLPVRRILSLEPEYAVPVTILSSQLSYFQNMKAPNSWTGHFRGSPIEEKADDVKVIINALEDASKNPIARPFDVRKLNRKIPVFETKNGLVAIPESRAEELAPEQTPTVTHEEIQWQLLALGQDLGLDVWVAKDDRGSSFNGKPFTSLSRLRSSLPIQFDHATNRIIELIDVLWLRGNAIIAAFEVEHTTSVYSGLLRMADLVAMQPNINIQLYIVAPDERREKVLTEINRPTFSRALKPPLTKICKYVSYSALTEKLDQVRRLNLIRRLMPEFIDDIAESVELNDVG